MKLLFRMVIGAFVTIGVLSHVNAKPGEQLSVSSNARCPHGYLPGCGGCNALPQEIFKDGKLITLPCTPDFSQCPCAEGQSS